MLLTLTVFGVWLGVQVHRARQQSMAIALINELGGSVRYAHQYDEDLTWDHKVQLPGPGWLRQLIGDEYFARVVGAEMDNSDIVDTDLVPQRHD